MVPDVLFLALALLAPQDAPSAPHAGAGEPPATFLPPVRLMAGERPVGEEQLFPSPVLQDLDGDGVDELVVGDLLGNVIVHRRADADDPTVWTEGVPLERADGEPLDFHNW